MTRLIFLLGILVASSCGDVHAPNSNPHPCSLQWQEYVEEKLQTGDAEGHGPDMGSMEWRSVVEFKLGIRGDPEIPSRESDEWCTYIDKKIRQSGV